MRSILLFGSGILLLASGPETPGQNKPTDELLLRLQDPNARTRRLAAEALGKKKDEAAIEPLILVLKDSDRSVRAAAQDALVRIGPKVVPALTRALSDGSELARLGALLALERFGPEIKYPIKELTAALKDKDSAVRIRAASMLGQAGADARSALPGLYEAAADQKSVPSRHDGLPNTAIRAALKIDPNCGPSLAVAVVPSLKAALDNSNEATVEGAASALAELGTHAKTALPALEAAAKKAKRLTAWSIRNAITAASDGATVRDRQAPSQTRCDAIRYICGERATGTKVIALLVELLKDPDARVRAVATDEIGKIGPEAKEAIPILLGLLGDLDLDDAVRKEFFMEADPVPRALARMGAAAVPGVAEVLQDRNARWVKRLDAARTLGKMAGAAADAIDVLKAALVDKDDSIAVESAVAYIRVGGKRSEALPILRGGLRSQEESGFVVVRAAEAAERLGVQARELAPDLIPLLEHKKWRIRLAAAKALCAMGAAARPAMPRIAEILRSGDESERYLLVRAIPRLGAEAREALPALIEVLADRELATPALEAIGNIGPVAKSAVPAVLKLVSEKPAPVPPAKQEPPWKADHRAYQDRQSMEQAVLTLGRIGPDAKAAVPRLIPLIDSPDRFSILPVNAIRALGGIGPSARDAVPKLRDLLDHEERVMRVWAAYALARIDGDTDRQVAFLMELWVEDGELRRKPLPSVKRSIAQALELLGRDSRPARDLLLAALQDPKSTDAMAEIVQALGQLSEDAEIIVPKLAALIEQSVKDRNKNNTCRAAALALSSLGPKAREALPQLHKLLVHEDDRVADAAAQAIETLEPRKKD
jgi:HEAT repeat protein